jgi:signal transduction histidine kinase
MSGSPIRRRVPSLSGVTAAERHDLEQAFVNLVLNAVEAMQGVGWLVLRSRIVSASSLRRSDARRLEDDDAADSGPGVSDADAERIFEPFYSSKTATRGTGIGLAMVAQTVESVGGTIWVQPAREGGAAFVLLLPLVSATVMARERN